MRRLLVALGFLTIIPVKIQPKSLELSSSMLFFPLVGFSMGAILILVNKGAALLFPPVVANLLVVVTFTILSGALHLDGLADTLDGFYGGKTKEEILRIMRDSRTGVMGVVGITLVLLAKWACLSEMSPKIKDVALLIMPTFGRWSMVLAAFISPYAREGKGLGEPFAGKIKPSVFWTSGVFALITSVVLLGMDGVSLFLFIALVAIGLVEFIKRRIGGMSGDTLGSICELVEVAVLLILGRG